MNDAPEERCLTLGEREKLEKDNQLVPSYKQRKFEQEAQKHWDLFYKRNETRFFRDRHWTKREFEELIDNCQTDSPGVESSLVEKVETKEKKSLLEVGCGVGNFIFPLIEEGTNMFIYACDFSPRAIDFVKANPLYNESKCKAFHCDITEDSICKEIPVKSVHIVSLVFVLSAIHPDKMRNALENIYEVLVCGGILLFRDYGLFDQAMLRFKPGHKLSENFYLRQDGTRAYYFSKAYVESLFTNAGFEVVANNYVHRKTVNVKEDIDVPRIFIQGKFRKP